MKKIDINNITNENILNYSKVGYEFLIESVVEWATWGIGSKFYIVDSEYTDYDGYIFYIEEREFKENNNKLKEDDWEEWECTNYYCEIQEKPLFFKVLEVIET
jgi:hypothetical protein